MTGQEIANNLRNSKEKWTSLKLYRPADDSFCVLGLKAYEAGVKKKYLDHNSLNYHKIFTSSFLEGSSELERKFSTIYQLNDSCRTKEELIAKFELPENSTTDFPVEKFVQHALKVQKELEREAE